jgi:hypothetical protein
MFALTMLICDVLMAVSFVILLLIPLYEMWIKQRPLMASGRPVEPSRSATLLTPEPPGPAPLP